MPLFDLETRRRVTRIPFPDKFKLLEDRLSSEEFEAIRAKLNSMISGDEIHTAGWMPGHNWEGTEFQPIYEKAARGHQELSAKLFGLFVWTVFMDRPEKWITGRFEKDGEPIGSRTYFLDRSG